MLAGLLAVSLRPPAESASGNGTTRLLDDLRHVDVVAATGSAGRTPEAPRSRRWSSEDIAREWSRTSEGGSVVLRSPDLELARLDELDSIVVRFSATSGLRSFSLLWSREGQLTRAEALRNHRELLVYGDPPPLVFRVRGEELAYVSMRRDEPSQPVRHLFLRLPAAAHATLREIALIGRADWLAASRSGRTRFSQDGESRDAFFTATPGMLRYRGAIAPGAVLSFGVRGKDPRARLHLTVRLGRDPDPTLVFERALDDAGTAWHDFRIALPPSPGSGSVLTLAAESDRPRDAALWSNPALLAPPHRPRPPNVILYVLDALRADHLGDNGYARSPAPFLDELAATGVAFRSCYAQASWTKPSVASLLTSLYPETHGVGAKSSMDALPEAVLTLQGALRAAGYTTAQFSANGFASALSGLDRGFDFVYGPEAFAADAANGAPKIRSDEINARLLPWLEAHAGEPFFAYVHSVDTHPPWDETPGRAAPADRYDAALSFNDAQLRRLYERVRELGLEQDTLFVVTADHGEAFGEHGKSGHGLSVHQEEIHVPLLVTQRRRLAPRIVVTPVQSIDVMPTILARCAPRTDRSRLQGVDLLASDGPRGRPAFSMRFVYPGDLTQPDPAARESYAVVAGRWKWIATGADGALYDLARDPLESVDLQEREPVQARRLKGLLAAFHEEERRARDRFFKEHAPRETARATAEDALDRLRSLGYLR